MKTETAKKAESEASVQHRITATEITQVTFIFYFVLLQLFILQHSTLVKAHEAWAHCIYLVAMHHTKITSALHLFKCKGCCAVQMSCTGRL